MSIFGQRMRRRRELDDDLYDASIRGLASVVNPDVAAATGDDKGAQAARAMADIGDYLGVSIAYVTARNLSQDRIEERLLRPHGIMWRRVRLDAGWSADGTGAMLATLKDGGPIALIPAWNQGYVFHDPRTGERVRATRETEAAVESEATLYYRALPHRRIDTSDVWSFAKSCVSTRQLVLLAVLTLAVTLLSMVTPDMAKRLLSAVTDSSNTGAVATIAVVLLLVTIASYLMTVARRLVSSQISSRVTVFLQAAFMMRVLEAPADALRTHSAGDLGARVASMYQNTSQLSDMVLTILLSAASSLVCFFQMFAFASGPALVALITMLALVIFYVIVIRAQVELSADRMGAQAEESGLTYAMIDGIGKIMLSGAERRAFARWADTYRDSVKTIYDPPLFLKVADAIPASLLTAGTIATLVSAATSGVTATDFCAFTVSYGIVTDSFAAIGMGASRFAAAIPLFRLLSPVMDFVPEVTSKRDEVVRLKGSIAFDHVTFAYGPGTPAVVDDLSLSIRAGEYVAIVGATGCGKSTLMRLMLGFERPQHGRVLFDDKDLASLDVTSLRKRIGSVLQDGDIMRGTILSNITLAGEDLTEDEAWEAAEKAGIADDIRAMPLQMMTPLPDGGKGVSGGQRQRLLIARAIAPRPDILIFDEATSALDNVRQREVAEAIAKMGCTRVVIAHRLSTVKDCDRILCLDVGHIVEEGTYQELMEKDGFFAELVRRQTV